MAQREPQDSADETPAVIDEPGDTPDEGAEAAPIDVEAVVRERDDYYDRLLRKGAEFENYRKRVERERREQADHTVTDLLVDLLTIVDDFERALAADSDEGTTSGYRKRVELIHTKLHDLLRRRGVRAIEALGADFDPNIHQAVSQEASPNHREGEVIEELRRGYMLGDRLLRPAMVKVATRD